MTKRNFQTLENKNKQLIFRSTADKIGIPPFAVEKDWWITQVLATVFELPVSSHFVFKGGTSLSKAWKLIQRFSEDIDLAIDREFLGFSGDLGKNQRDKLRKAAGAYVDDDFFPQFKIALQKKD